MQTIIRWAFIRGGSVQNLAVGGKIKQINMSNFVTNKREKN